MQHMVKGDCMIEEQVSKRLENDNFIYTPEVMVNKVTGMCVRVGYVWVL
jgi:hypothetical protein